MHEDSWIPASWPAPNTIRAGCTTRVGGHSKHPYDSLNLAMHVGDIQESVSENRRELSAHLQLPTQPRWLQQVHGCLVSTDQHAHDQADACMTRQTNRVCAVMTADCLPLLITDLQGEAMAAVHAGWRGLAVGVIRQTIDLFTAPPTELLVWLGPAIGPEAFEVGDDVFDRFTGQSEMYRSAFVARPNRKWNLDIYQLARLQLGALGVTQVYGGDYCTFDNPRLFFSYRRDGDTGRMASLIWRTD